MLTSAGLAFAYFASAFATVCTELGGSEVALIATSRPLAVTVGFLTPFFSSAAVTPSFVGVTPFFVVKVNVPPGPARWNWTAAWSMWPYFASASEIVLIGSFTTCACTRTLSPP